MFYREINYVWEIAMECIVIAVIIFILSVFGGYAREALIAKEIENQTMTDIREYRKFYEYTFGIEAKKSELPLGSKDNPYGNVAGGLLNNLQKYKDLSSVVKGDDVVRFIGLYPRQYNVYIYYTGKNNTEFKSLTKESLDEEWGLGGLGDTISDDKYYCTVVYDDTLGFYESVIFTKVPENRSDLEEIGIKR